MRRKGSILTVTMYAFLVATISISMINFTASTKKATTHDAKNILDGYTSSTILDTTLLTMINDIGSFVITSPTDPLQNTIYAYEPMIEKINNKVFDDTLVYNGVSLHILIGNEIGNRNIKDLLEKKIKNAGYKITLLEPLAGDFQNSNNSDSILYLKDIEVIGEIKLKGRVVKTHYVITKLYCPITKEKERMTLAVSTDKMDIHKALELYR